MESSSPYHEIRSLVEDYRAGRFGGDEFADALERLDQRLQYLSEGLSSANQPPTLNGGGFHEDEGEDDPEETEELEPDGEVPQDEVPLECLQLFTESLDRLRDFLDTEDPDAAHAGLELAREAHDFWLELLETRGDLVERLGSQLEDFQEV